MHCLLEQQTEWLAVLAARWNWQPRALAEHLVFFAALHDIGKFSRSFQRLCPHDSPGLVSCEKARPYTQRHDTLGFLLWLDCLSRTLPDNLLPAPETSCGASGYAWSAAITASRQKKEAAASCMPMTISWSMTRRRQRHSVRTWWRCCCRRGCMRQRASRASTAKPSAGHWPA
ncbi:hypothetical protein DAI18_12520 [Microvirgula aerodenitrificans]|uniref:HD Cas3-type domain-containing protein n=2 Tax=Microvirgula aerodenitrificans TaxID=57480 RepID=A0A2S0PFD9_9NEIS|nr:hypothetical protein DAI18_12520 [Microvirgula aerodenitrificans]